ncbi:MAG: hypothetical protein NTZ86_09675 [Legionellales bacterium]|nr:hypothetical protein [Legionellales bacterium]
MRKHIDQLLVDGKYEDACILINEFWQKEAEAANKAVENIAKKLDILDKRLRVKKSAQL